MNIQGDDVNEDMYPHRGVGDGDPGGPWTSQYKVTLSPACKLYTLQVGRPWLI